jgi:hypothetical protein
MDVKKLGRIPDGGGWAALGRAATVAHKHKKEPIGFDYVHSVVDDHTRYAYSEVLDHEKGTTDRTDALAPWLENYNTQRRHSSLAGRPPVSRLLPT